VALINQRQAAKEEQQRIKNLVLNYDLRDNEEQDGEENLTPYGPSIDIHTSAGTNEKPPSHHHHNRLDIRSGKDRGQRVRKLQLSDVDWYDNPGRRPCKSGTKCQPPTTGGGATSSNRPLAAWP
jgi:regulator of nonsense transcripts 2